MSDTSFNNADEDDDEDEDMNLDEDLDLDDSDNDMVVDQKKEEEKTNIVWLMGENE